MSTFLPGTLALLLSLLCWSSLGAQVRAAAPTDTVRLQRPVPTLTRPPLQARDSISVPVVIGQTVPAAVRSLIAAGLRPVNVDSVAAPAPAGRVVEQRPKGGSMVPRGSPGWVIVGVAPPAPPAPELVPSLVGMTPPEAARALVERKLRLVSVDTVARTGGSGRVAGQQPAAGSVVPRDRAVALTVTVTVPTVAMPELRGQPLTRARAMLAERGLVLATVDSVRRDGANRTVFDQKPAAGEQVRRGERVAVVLAVPVPATPVVPPVVVADPPPADPAPTPTPLQADEPRPVPAGPPPEPAPSSPVSPPIGPVAQEPGDAPAAPTPAAPVEPVVPGPVTAARVDTVLVPAQPARSAVPWVLLGLLIGALLTAAALAGRQRLASRRERQALRLALQAGPPTVRIAAKRSPDTQELRLPGPLFAGPAIRILPHHDPGEIRLVMHPSQPTREDRP